MLKYQNQESSGKMKQLFNFLKNNLYQLSKKKKLRKYINKYSFDFSIFIKMGNSLPCCVDNDIHTGPDRKSCRNISVILPEKQIVPKKPVPDFQNSPSANTRSHIQTKKEEKSQKGPQNYQCLKYLGKGSYGFVVLALQKSTNKRFAMKIIPKTKINQINLLQTNLIPQIRRYPFLTNIIEIFQNEENIYIVMQYIPKGDLYFYSKKQDIIFTENSIRDMITQIVFAVQFLHKQGIVYRQLKPENILVTNEGHIKLTDYGLSKIMVQKELEKGISTFFGSMDYMAPEALNGTFDQRADLWAMGVLMYQLKFKQHILQKEGQIQYNLTDYREMLQNNFIAQRINNKIGLMSLQFRDILMRLLQKEPANRISIDELKKHQFFQEVDWQAVQNRQNQPPLADLLNKGNFAKFRDPSTQSNNRFDVLQKHSKNSLFALELFEVRNSE